MGGAGKCRGREIGRQETLYATVVLERANQENLFERRFENRAERRPRRVHRRRFRIRRGVQGLAFPPYERPHGGRGQTHRTGGRGRSRFDCRRPDGGAGTCPCAAVRQNRRCIRRRAYARTRCQARRRSGSGPAARVNGCNGCFHGVPLFRAVQASNVVSNACTAVSTVFSRRPVLSTAASDAAR